MHPLFKKTYVRNIVSAVVAGYLRFVYWTSRWKVQGVEHMSLLIDDKKPVIVVFWHNAMTMAPFAWIKGVPFHMLISEHGDGQLIARIVQHFGIQCIAGSSSRQQGTVTLKKMLRALKEGVSVGITPDGPRGPRGVLKEGIYALAKLSECPVLTLQWHSNSVCTLRTWDHMKIPLPFGFIRCIWSKPIICSGEDYLTKEIFFERLYAELPAIA